MSKLLVVEDDATMRELYRENLMDSYEIVETGDPTAALGLALEQKPDCILLDISLPEYSGFELCQALSSLSFSQLTPVIVVSGRPSDVYKAACLKLGAVDYFQKPVDFEVLRARLTLATKARQRDRRREVRIRLRTILRLEGTDVQGNHFEVLTATDDISAHGFLCSLTLPLAIQCVVDVFLTGEHRHHVGRAKAMRSENPGTPQQRYGFQFVGDPKKWLLQQ